MLRLGKHGSEITTVLTLSSPATLESHESLSGLGDPQEMCARLGGGLEEGRGGTCQPGCQRQVLAPYPRPRVTYDNVWPAPCVFCGLAGPSWDLHVLGM